MTRNLVGTRRSGSRQGGSQSITQKRVNRLGFTLVFPALLVIAVLAAYPTIAGIVGSFQKLTLSDRTTHFVGLQNYIVPISDPDFQRSVFNTVGYLVVITVLAVVIGMVMALWLRTLTGYKRAIALTVIIIPWAVPGTVSGVLASLILKPTGSGLLNSVLQSLGIISEPQLWLQGPIAGIILIGVVTAWTVVPLGVVILLAGLEGIPNDINEASTVDGASAIRRYFSITLPLLRPALAIVLLNAAIRSISLFDQVFVLVGFDPEKVTLTSKIYLYAFRDFDFGYSYAASVIATVLTAGIAIIYLKFVYREVEF